MSVASDVKLRRAWWFDRGYVLRLRNRPSVMALGRDLRLATGVWWDNVKSHLVLVTVKGRGRVGYIIIAPQNENLQRREVSIVLEPRARGYGIGTAALRQLRTSRADLYAEVDLSNVASLLAFQRAGYIESGQQDGRRYFVSVP